MKFVKCVPHKKKLNSLVELYVKYTIMTQDEPVKYTNNLSLVLKSGIEQQDMIILLNKMLDNNSAQIENEKLQIENEKKQLDLIFSEGSFDRYFVVFGFIISFATSGVVMFYLKELIDNCAISAVNLIGRISKFGIENTEVFVRNSATYAWNGIIYAGEYIGMLNYAKYEATYVKEGFTGMHVSAATDAIVENTSMASLFVTLLLYIIITYTLVFVVIIILKLSQCKKIHLSFVFWKMGVETR
jgi:hypothetical protein